MSKTTKIITWIAVALSIIALGLVAYFAISSRSPDIGTAAPGFGNQQGPIAAAVECTYVDGTSEQLQSAQDCRGNAQWLRYCFTPTNCVDNPDPTEPPGGQTGDPGEIDPQEIGTCFINYMPPPPVGSPDPGFEYYVTTYQNCLNDPESYAFCIDETARVPTSCEFISRSD